MPLKPALFLDRDGVLVEELSYITSPEQLRLLPYAGQALRAANQLGFTVVVITNQSAVARGLLTLQGLHLIHQKLRDLLHAAGASIDRIYFCPHHPDVHLPGGIPDFLGPCACRKPAPGLIQRAIADVHIDPKASFFVGDKTSDVLAAQNAGVPSVLVRTGFAGNDGEHRVTPDYVIDSLADMGKLMGFPV